MNNDIYIVFVTGATLAYDIDNVCVSGVTLWILILIFFVL